MVFKVAVYRAHLYCSENTQSVVTEARLMELVVMSSQVGW